MTHYAFEVEQLIAERDAARLVARKRLELLVAEGIIGGECEGCLMEHPLVGEYHEHGPSGIRIKCCAQRRDERTGD